MNATSERNVTGIIEKWYKALEFPAEYDLEFYNALETYRISSQSTLDTYDLDCPDGKQNLLHFLYFCENLEENYFAKGISREILLDTVQDLVRWTKVWSDLKGQLYLGELSWLSRHLKMELFQLGRLQFAMGKDRDIPILEIHIPAYGPLDIEACKESIQMAKAFFGKYYPEYDYRYFTCHSWLLDSTLDCLLSENSNIRKFKDMFHIHREDDSDAILRYVFRWDANRENLVDMPCGSSFSRQVKEAYAKGCQFHEGYGSIQK